LFIWYAFTLPLILNHSCLKSLFFSTWLGIKGERVAKGNNNRPYLVLSVFDGGIQPVYIADTLAFIPCAAFIIYYFGGCFPFLIFAILV
jgi:hypothetical protein